MCTQSGLCLSQRKRVRATALRSPSSIVLLLSLSCSLASPLASQGKVLLIDEAAGLMGSSFSAEVFKEMVAKISALPEDRAVIMCG